MKAYFESGARIQGENPVAILNEYLEHHTDPWICDIDVTSVAIHASHGILDITFNRIGSDLGGDYAEYFDAVHIYFE